MQTRRTFILILGLVAGIACGGLLSQAQVLTSTAKPATIQTMASQSAQAATNALCDAYEPNDDRKAGQWWGPMQSEQPIVARLCQDDPEDNYYFDVTATDPVQLTLSLPPALRNHTGMWLYHTSNLNTPICSKAPPAPEATLNLSCLISQTGRYVVRLYTDGAYDNVNTYSLRAEFRGPTPHTHDYAIPDALRSAYAVAITTRMIWESCPC